MTYCIAIKLKRGLLAAADTRITSDVGISTARKITLHKEPESTFFLMTSGLRSCRDKTLAYFEEALKHPPEVLEKMHHLANLLGQQIKKVSGEDKKDLEANGYHFNLHGILGGQFKNEPEPRLFMLYPEGNWIEITEETPFGVIGNSKFGIPLLKRALTVESDWQDALKLVFLSFDATYRNASDVGYPVDVALFPRNSFEVQEKRFHEKDLRDFTEQFNQGILDLVHDLPSDWTQGLPLS
jgi:putative proteasome-type protease